MSNKENQWLEPFLLPQKERKPEYGFAIEPTELYRTLNENDYIEQHGIGSIDELTTRQQINRDRAYWLRTVYWLLSKSIRTESQHKMYGYNNRKKREIDFYTQQAKTMIAGLLPEQVL